jgi:hypothetical protein
MRGTAGRILLVGCFAVSALTLSASGAAAETPTIGQTGVPNTSCSVGDWAGFSVSSGAQYFPPAVPGVLNWTIDSWSTYASPAAGQRMKLKVYSSGSTYRVLAQDVPRTLTPGVLNTFATNINVTTQYGSFLLGMTTLTPGIGCAFGPMGESFLVSPGTDTATGDVVNFSNDSGERLNISAKVEPTNTFSLGAITLNKRRGNATLVVNKLPNQGVLNVSGKGVKSTGAIIGTVLPATATLVIRAKGRKRTTLNQTGKVTLRPNITFTPLDGSARSTSAKVKLKKL